MQQVKLAKKLGLTPRLRTLCLHLEPWHTFFILNSSSHRSAQIFFFLRKCHFAGAVLILGIAIISSSHF
ncbi:hypothetical protein [Dermatophilus congolensis]|uniref:hypothetical protein n=1 Tax=Dermatophilus congolensis TaxID=1863 RepID=UPI001AAE762E|nr:hypothetical protein [Dermatophilus congolensis]MBO3142996.1 hypothetical protein [Dermatophilus congolensis]MBO3151985.1 hypothetical protein [Dermatophilus congolensis]MBO3161007.1 hypothetical protein [Dermatophilus congolensis]MBO3163269.1 hypothetical protein [Dermatophilus congolensis]MBO3176826.1 hypothetical protein [Dermatophilus congolensis]